MLRFLLYIVIKFIFIQHTFFTLRIKLRMVRSFDDRTSAALSGNVFYVILGELIIV